MKFDIILSGFGGQGIMSAGRIIAYGAMIEGKEVSWLPSYGPEMRGGTANCNVIISESKIASPIITNPSCVIAMNKPSFDKFTPSLKDEGIVIYDSSLIEDVKKNKRIQEIGIPATQIANELGNQTVANVIIIGLLVKITKVISKESFIEGLKNILPKSKHKYISINEKAFDLGYNYDI